MTGTLVYKPMRYIFPLILAVTALVPAMAQPRTPVIVELFTSEGCSSCPPADQLLSQLEKTQPFPGIEVIVLGEHVDYWNELGWPDRFATHLFTARQQEYGRKLALSDVYTPQMVVNGQVEFSGGDSARANREIRKAAEGPKAKIDLRLLSGDTVKLNVEALPQGTRDAEVFLAVTETNLETNVQRGENHGRLLKHAGVVRSLTSLAKIDTRKTGAYSAEAKVGMAPEWRRENVTIVVFVQDRTSGKILGAATARAL
jgi:hypothetical protein